MSSIRPLAGLVVVDIDHSIAAPYAGMVLGELGAEVIKVSPAIRNSIPSVVLNDGTLSPVVISPIASPINAHAASATTMAATTGSPAACAYPMMNGDGAKT
jgi:CoA-transferase family III